MGFEEVSTLGANLSQQPAQPQVQYLPAPLDLRSGSVSAKEIREFDLVNFETLSKSEPLGLEMFLNSYMKQLGWVNLTAAEQKWALRQIKDIIAYANGDGNERVVHDKLIEFVTYYQMQKSRGDLPEIGIRARTAYITQRATQEVTTKQHAITEPAGFVQKLIGGQ